MIDRWVCLTLISLLAIVSVSGCLGGDDGDGGGEEEKVEFKEEDISDWAETNENAEPMSTLEIIDLLAEHMEEICPGGRITAFGAVGTTGIGLDRETGKCPAWQFYLLRYNGTQARSKVVNIAQYGWTVVNAEHDVADIYDEWEYSKVTVDSKELPGIASGNGTVSEWIGEHPNYRLDIQSYHGPPIDSGEESYYMKFTAGDDQLDVYIAGDDGTVIDVKDPNDWSWF